MFRKMWTYSNRLLKLFIPKFGYTGRTVAALLVFLCGVVLIDNIWIREEAFEALVRIDPMPRTQELITQEHYVEANEYLSFFMEYDYVKTSHDAVTLYEEIQEQCSLLNTRG